MSLLYAKYYFAPQFSSIKFLSPINWVSAYLIKFYSQFLFVYHMYPNLIRRVVFRIWLYQRLTLGLNFLAMFVVIACITTISALQYKTKSLFQVFIFKPSQLYIYFSICSLLIVSIYNWNTSEPGAANGVI